MPKGKQSVLPEEKQHLHDEHNDGDSECTRCSRIDQLNEEQLNAAARLKKNNEDLKSKIEELSAVLAEKLELLKQKKQAGKKEKQLTSTDDPAKKELEAINKKVFQAQKQLKLLEEKQAIGAAGLKITEMKNEIAEKQGQLQKILKENKLLEEIKASNEAAITELETNSETHDLEEEQKQMKTLLKELKKDTRIIDRETTKQCEYLVTIEQKHKEVCDKFGVPSSLNQERFELMQELITENHKNRQIKQDKQEKEKQKKLGNVEINANSYKMILNEMEKKKQEKQEIEFMQKREVDETQARIKATNAERDSLLLKLRDKEKELNIAIMRINELKRLTKHNALTPLGIESSKPGRGAGAGGEFSAAIRRKDIRRDQKGVAVGSETACSWDNCTELPDTKDYMITQITLWHKDEYIRGMSFEFKLKGGEKTLVEGFTPDSGEGLEEKVLKFKGTEYINSIIGYQNNLHIEYLRIVSSRGNYVLAGSDKNQAKCKKFEFEIRKDERPISFFGVVDKVPIKRRKDQQGTEGEHSQQQLQEEEMVLTNIGVEFKKKDQQQNIRTSIGQNLANSQVSVIDAEDAELYGDQSKKTPSKNQSQKRKIIDALNSKHASVGGDEDEFGTDQTKFSQGIQSNQSQPQNGMQQWPAANQQAQR